MSDASDPRHASPDHAKGHQAADDGRVVAEPTPPAAPAAQHDVAAFERWRAANIHRASPEAQERYFAAKADNAARRSLQPAVRAVLRDAANALAAEARNKRATIHHDVFGDKLPDRYDEIAARCRRFADPDADAAPAPLDGPPAPPAIEDAPRRHDLRWSWDWRSELWFAHEPGRATSTVHRPPAGMTAIPMWAPNEGRWFWFDDGGYQKRRQTLLQCSQPLPLDIMGRTRATLQASSCESIDEAAQRQMAEVARLTARVDELEAEMGTSVSARVEKLRAQLADARRDVDIWKRDANALRERLASADDELGKAGLELANRRRDWHEDRARMLEILAGLVPDVAKRADVESLTDIAHVVVGELGAQAVAAARWRSFDVLFQSIGAWSIETFGPGPRVEAILDHVAKEARECAAKPGDAEEWIDLAMLAMDGARRAAKLTDAKDWIQALEAKHQKNQARTWPDWRTQDPAKAIEHVRDDLPAGAIGVSAPKVFADLSKQLKHTARHGVVAIGDATGYESARSLIAQLVTALCLLLDERAAAGGGR